MERFKYFRHSQKFEINIKMVNQNGKEFVREVAQIFNGTVTITPSRGKYREKDGLASLLVDTREDWDNSMY